MRLCNCGYPILPAYCVAYKELICFNCGNTYVFFNDCARSEETPELREFEKEMEEVKKKVYAMDFEKEEDGRTSKSITEEELKQRLDANTSKEVEVKE